VEFPLLKKQWLLKIHTRYNRGRREKAIFKKEEEEERERKSEE